MSASTAGTATGEAAFDVHGIEPVPAADRTSTSMDQFWIWMGANIAPINWVLGALGIVLGLSFIETVITIAIGNVLGCAIFGAFALMGHRTGINVMVLSRAAFGRRGAYVPAAAQLLLTMGWIGVNTWVVLDLALGALGEVGITGGTGLKYTVAFGIMAVQVLVAVWGFYAIRTFERWTVPVTAAIMGVMTILALTQTDIALNAGTATGGDKVTAFTQLFTAIGIGWAITWLVYAADYSRFVIPRVSDRKVMWAAGLGMFVPTVWLAALGAAVASAGGGSDPSDLVISTFGVMALPVLLLILHGPIATNILNFYSCSLAALTIGMKVARWKISLAAGVIASAVLVVFVESGEFASTFDQWLVSLVVWISPWAAICAVEFFIVRGGKLDPAQMYEEETRERFGDVNWRALISLALGVAAGWAWEFGLVTAMQGPVAKAFGNTDLSWLTGALVAAGSYWLLVGRAEYRARRAGRHLSAAPVVEQPSVAAAPVGVGTES
ncbi:MAG TPA: cytosine permease [Solirubrobacterales bacterium]|nr:cytosine permease [Solirubrobacterales bacterium]